MQLRSWYRTVPYRTVWYGSARWRLNDRAQSESDRTGPLLVHLSDLLSATHKLRGRSNKSEDTMPAQYITNSQNYQI